MRFVEIARPSPFPTTFDPGKGKAMIYEAAIQDCSGPCKNKEAVMLYEDIREFYEARREPGVSIRQEIFGTAIFRAGVVSGIMVVLCMPPTSRSSPPRP